MAKWFFGFSTLSNEGSPHGYLSAVRQRQQLKKINKCTRACGASQGNGLKLFRQCHEHLQTSGIFFFFLFSAGIHEWTLTLHVLDTCPWHFLRISTYFPGNKWWQHVGAPASLLAALRDGRGRAVKGKKEKRRTSVGRSIEAALKLAALSLHGGSIDSTRSKIGSAPQSKGQFREQHKKKPWGKKGVFFHKQPHQPLCWLKCWIVTWQQLYTC